MADNKASSSVIIAATGLNTSPNDLGIPDGGMREASNIIIKRDGIIESRRGFQLYGSQLPSVNQIVKVLTTYRNRIIRHYSDKLAFDSDGSGTFIDFEGSYFETQPGLRIKFIESNGNLYFTTSEGIKKISARYANDFSSGSGFISGAGAIKAVDLDGQVLYTPNSQSAWLPQDGAVAYRVVWGYNDINNNLILGAPSQREIVGNSMQTLIIRDYMRCLDVLDNLDNTPLTSARINDKNYISSLGLTLDSTAGELWSSLTSLSTKLDTDIFFADDVGATPPLTISTAVVTSNILTITFSAGTASDYFIGGSEVFFGGAWTGFAAEDLAGANTIVTSNATTITLNVIAADGAVVLSSPTIYSNEFRDIPQPSAPSVPASNDNLVSLQSYYLSILTKLGSLLPSIVSPFDQIAIGSLDITTTATTLLTITIPDGINSNYFYQIYRSPVSKATGVNSFVDVSPSDELQLVYEAYPTSQELIDSVIVIEDITPDSFRGANLYTNASTGDGALSANDIPPFAKDINRYKNTVFYANTRTNQKLPLSLLGITQLISDFDLGIIPKITIANATATNTYSFVTGLQEITEIVTVADVVDSLNGTYFYIDSTDSSFYVWLETTIAVDPMVPDRVGIKVNIDTNDTDIQVATRIRDKLTTYLDDFIVGGAGSTVEVIGFKTGVTSDAVDIDTGFTITTTQQGRGERIQPQIVEITTVAGNLFKSSGVSDYFEINTTLDKNQFYVWFKRGTSTDPLVSGKFGIQIDITGAETDDQVADLIVSALSGQYFDASFNLNIVTIVNIQYGTTTNATETVLNAGFLIQNTQIGALEVLLSPLISPAQAVEQTALSFIRAINQNPGEDVYAYYLSSVTDVPGKMSIESRTLELASPFYILGNNANTGLSFNANVSPEKFISSISASNPTIITSTTPHGLVTSDTIMISSTDSVPVMDGLAVVTVLTPTTFTINKEVYVAGTTTGGFIKIENAVFSENEEKSNRIYYSKFQQPESVPLLNYFDVGSQDKAILRIVPLRDSLFVFKEDGLYRISGDSAPFQLNLFDNSFIVIAPDSVSVCNNIIYAWTTQGIQSLTEGGASVISRNIDNIILRTQSSNFINFKTATWGTGYESDNSYTVYTVSEEDDETATIGYRYSTLTQSWTTIDKSTTCGIINNFDDKMYLGVSDIAYIEKERKTFTRLDYADREYNTIISNNTILDNTILLPSVTKFKVGDVFVQDQTITTFQFNTMLDKLDTDSGVSDNDYYTLYMSAGSNARSSLNALAAKLDADTGVAYTQFIADTGFKNGIVIDLPVGTIAKITSINHGLVTGRVVQFDSMDSTPSITGPYTVTVLTPDVFTVEVRITAVGTTGNWQTLDSNFQDIKADYNLIMTILNNDTGASYNNYALINSNTLQETIITAINHVSKRVTLNLALDYLLGSSTVYTSIVTTYTYSPNTMGDPLSLKHLREATLMFEFTNITGGTMSFATDLLPEFINIDFKMSGNGIFGHSSFGTGYFGGGGNEAPFRTYIPRQCQRCRYIMVKFTHSTAREKYSITGVSITGNMGQSTRAYR